MGHVDDRGHGQEEEQETYAAAAPGAPDRTVGRGAVRTGRAGVTGPRPVVQLLVVPYMVLMDPVGLLGLLPRLPGRVGHRCLPRYSVGSRRVPVGTRAGSSGFPSGRLATGPVRSRYVQARNVTYRPSGDAVARVRAPGLRRP